MGSPIGLLHLPRGLRVPPGLVRTWSASDRRSPAFRHAGPSLAHGVLKGFTLIEMMVVVGIIVLLVSITMPAIGPMLASNKEAQVLNTLGGLLINAQATASQTSTSVALRVERAFKTNDLGIMVDAAGRTRFDPGYTGVPVWLDYQRVRFVSLAAYKDQAFSQPEDTKVYDLPPNYWLAPDYALGAARTPPTWPTSPPPATLGSLAEGNLGYTPTWAGMNFAAYNRLENFYIVFNQAGDLVYYPRGKLNYTDKTQQYLSDGVPVPPGIRHPDGSSRSVFIYDRTQWKEIHPEDSASRINLLQSARSVNVNRITGSIVEAGTQ